MNKLILFLIPIIFLVGCKVEDTQSNDPNPPIVIDVITPPIDNPIVDNPIVDNPIVDNPIVDNPITEPLIIPDEVPASYYYANQKNLPTVYILVNFTNAQFSSFPEDTDASYTHRLFGTSVGQVNHYWAANFHGKFRQSPATESYGTTNDGIIRVSVDLPHPGTTLEREPWSIVLGAVMAQADPFINLKTYDTNNDGKISSYELSINFIMAGFDAAVDSSQLATSIWPHSWCGTYTGTHDAVEVFNCSLTGRYTVLPQREADHSTPIGVIVHELGHSIFLLPDLYDTDGSTEGLGFLSLMSAGSWGGTPGSYVGSKPVLMDAWSKVQLGHSYTNVTKTNSYDNMIPAGFVGNNIYKVFEPGENRYSYLLEHKVNAGYDAGYTWVAPDFTGGILPLRIDAYGWNNSWDGLHKVSYLTFDPLSNYSNKHFLNSNGGHTSMNNEKSIEFPGTISNVNTNNSNASFSYQPR